MQGRLCCADHMANIIYAERKGVYDNHDSITWYMQKTPLYRTRCRTISGFYFFCPKKDKKK